MGSSSHVVRSQLGLTSRCLERRGRKQTLPSPSKSRSAGDPHAVVGVVLGDLAVCQRHRTAVPEDAAAVDAGRVLRDRALSRPSRFPAQRGSVRAVQFAAQAARARGNCSVRRPFDQEFDGNAHELFSGAVGSRRKRRARRRAPAPAFSQPSQEFRRIARLRGCAPSPRGQERDAYLRRWGGRSGSVGR